MPLKIRHSKQILRDVPDSITFARARFYFRLQTALQFLEGILGRNSLAGLGMWQVDLALRREIRFSEHLRLHIRAEALNAFNHPNFADPVRYTNSPLFGQSTSMLNLMLGSGSPGSGLAPALQTGGPRSLQGSLRFQF